MIYDLFEAYEEEKKQMQAFDVLDVVFHIWTQLQTDPYRGVVIHSVYVDETQDFTQAELRLIMRLCTHLNDLFFCGDTAQTIASGVAFRFDDLRSLFKLEGQARVAALEQRTLAKPSFRSGDSHDVVIPKVHALSVNYRTHNGVLGVAAAMVDMLEALFPASVDSLPRERGFFAGPKPLLLRETALEEAVVMIAGAEASGRAIQFGAHQVILVRNQEAKARLPRAFDACLAMTILESKGLEFDDVFIWDFFADSRADSEWRVVLNFLQAHASAGARGGGGDRDGRVVAKEEGGGRREGSGVTGMLRALEFSDREHQILCDELKHLYTAVTRARGRLGACLWDAMRGEEEATCASCMCTLGMQRACAHARAPVRVVSVLCGRRQRV